jgi:hypothetical protein
MKLIIAVRNFAKHASIVVVFNFIVALLSNLGGTKFGTAQCGMSQVMGEKN